MSGDLPDYAKQKPQLKWQLPFEGSWPMAVAFVDGGKQLAAANQAGTILIWDLGLAGDALKRAELKPSGDRKAPGLAPVWRLVGHTNGVTRLASAPDGRTLYSASLDHTVRVWDLTVSPTGTDEIVIDSESREREAKKAGKKTPDSAPGAKVQTLEAAAVLTGHNDWVSALALSRDGRTLVTGDYAAQVIVWDLAAKKELRRWSGLPWNWIVSLALAPDAKTIAVAEFRYKRDDFDVPAAALRVWDVATAKPTLDLLKIQFPKYDPQASSYDQSQVWRKFVGDGLVGSDISPDGKFFAACQGGETDSGKVHVFDLASGKLLRTVSGHQSGATDVRFSDDGRYLFSTGRDTTLRITDVATGKEVAALGSARGGQFKDWLSAVAVSPDGRTIAATDIAGLVHVWTV
jgi:WD40 repeat protein